MTPSVYLAMLIPVIITLIFYYFKRHEFTWWEFFLPIIIVGIVIFGVKALTSYTVTQFTEYWGSSITSVVEEEPYNYWKTETCSSTTTDSKGNSTTTYYDCSHQEDIGPHWYGYSNIGEKMNLTEKQHDDIVRLFGTSKNVIDTRENYDANDRCVGSNGTKFEGKKVGKISKIYRTDWNGSDDTRKPYVSKHHYTNKIKSSDLSVFNIKIVKDKQVDSMGLFNYPEIGGGMFSADGGIDYPTILGRRVPGVVQKEFMKLNGKFGPSNQLRLWVLVFDDKPEIAAEYQRNYWVNGNKNEMVLCIGRKGEVIQWAHAFSWGTNNELTAKVEQMARDLYTYRDSAYAKHIPAIPITAAMRKAMKLQHLTVMPYTSERDTLMKIRVKSTYPVLNNQTWMQLYVHLNKALPDFKRRHFKEFDYLTVEPPTWVLILIYCLAIILSIGVNIWCISNDIYSDNGDNKSNPNSFNFYKGSPRYR